MPTINAATNTVEIDQSPAQRSSRTDPDRWVDEHGECLYRYAFTRVRREELAEDLVQETLLAALRARERFGGRSSERSWLVGILKNKICDYFRKLGREISFTDFEFLSGEHEERFDAGSHWIQERAPKDWKPEGEEALKREEFWQALHRGLQKLPERVAAVFVMREMDDVPSKTICERLNITEANLWVMFHRARMALRQYLESDFFEGKGGVKL